MNEYSHSTTRMWNWRKLCHSRCLGVMPRAPLPTGELTFHFWECWLPVLKVFPSPETCSVYLESIILRLGPISVVLLRDSNPSLLRTVPVLVMNVLCPWNPLNPRQTRVIDPPTRPKGGPPALRCNEWAQGSCGTRLKLVSRQDPFLWKRSGSSLTFSAMWEPREEMADFSVNQ